MRYYILLLSVQKQQVILIKTLNNHNKQFDDKPYKFFSLQ